MDKNNAEWLMGKIILVLMNYFYNYMDKILYKKLFRTAVFSSPIIGLYGVTPVYLFNSVPIQFIILAGSGIVVNIFIFWMINIAILRYFGTINKWRLYLFSYGLIVIFHLFFVVLRTFLAPPSIIEQGELIFKKDVLIAYPLISILAINTIILIICNSVLTSEKNKKAELEIEQLKINNLEAQKQALMQQLQPHFLFNTLSILKSLIKENPDEAEIYSVKLSEFLRYSIQAHQQDLISLEQELKFTNDYIDLQKVRFENSLVFHVAVPKDAYHFQLPTFSLQTLVENAVKHNSFTEKKPLHIKIEYADQAISVKNNKMPKSFVETTGIGLKNLNQRYKIITDKEILVVDQKEEFSVTVHLLNANQK